MKEYPTTATERFDEANFHIKYTLSFLKKFIYGDILEIGAGCGSFTKNYFNKNVKNILLIEVLHTLMNLKTIVNSQQSMGFTQHKRHHLDLKEMLKHKIFMMLLAI